MSSTNESLTHLFKTNFYNALIQITPFLPKHVFIHCKPETYPNHILLTLEKNPQNTIEDYALQLQEMGINAGFIHYNDKNCLAISADDFMKYAELLADQQPKIESELELLLNQKSVRPTNARVA